MISASSSRRGAGVDPGARARIGGVREEEPDRLGVAGRGRVMQRCPVVDPARLEVGAGPEQQLDQLAAISPVGGQRGKAGGVPIFGSAPSSSSVRMNASRVW
jgi:hypothetical protein